MKTLQEQYNLIKEGKGDKNHFFKSVRHLFPNLVTPANSYTDAVNILKSKGIISEGIGGVATKGNTPDWHKIFKENIAESAKAEEKETTKEVTDMATRGYDYKDEKNYDNVFGQEFLEGFYTEMGDPKNKDKNVDELRAIVAKNLAKDCNYYVKNSQFGVKDIGYTTEAPGLGTPKEAKGKYKSSGYGDLKESVLRAQIHLLIKEALTETTEFKKDEKVEFNGDVWTVIGTSVDSDGDKFVDIKLGEKTHKNTPISAIKKIDQSLLDLDKEWKDKLKKGDVDEAKKPSAGLSKKEKSKISDKLHKGKDIGKKGKGFEKVAKAAEKQYGSKEAGEKVAAAAMWKNLAKKK